MKKRKLEEMTGAEKTAVRKAMLYTLLGVALFCCVLISCFSCKNDLGPQTPELSDEQKAALWYTSIMDVLWTPEISAQC